MKPKKTSLLHLNNMFLMVGYRSYQLNNIHIHIDAQARTQIELLFPTKPNHTSENKKHKKSNSSFNLLDLSI